MASRKKRKHQKFGFVDLTPNPLKEPSMFWTIVGFILLLVCLVGIIVGGFCLEIK